MIENVYFSNFDLKVRKICFEKKGEKFTSVTFGEGSYLVEASLEYGSPKCHVMIGKYCSIAHGIKFIIGLNHNFSAVSTYPFHEAFKRNVSSCRNSNPQKKRQQIIIGNDVWIGAYTTIMGGVRIGNGAVVGAGSVVTKDVPPYAVVAGNPASIIRYRFDKNTIDLLQKLRWWNWTPTQIQQRICEFDDISSFVAKYFTKVEDFVASKACEELFHALAQSKQEGYTFYYFLPDLLSEEAVWKDVFKKFAEGSNDFKKILFVDIPRALPSPIIEQLINSVNYYKHSSILLNVSVEGYDVRAVLPVMDGIITTKEAEISYIVDLASSYDCEILYGFDDFL